MIIGKTSESISITELFEKYSEVSILKTVFPEITSIPCKIQSPFRTDNNPSFGIYLDDNKHIKFKDFGDSSCKGNLLDLLCKVWNCSFYQVFNKILEVMQKQEGSDVAIKSKQVRMVTRKEASENTKIQVAVRKWEDYDYEYWESYGVNKQWLHYAKIYPISHKIITKKDPTTGKTNKYIFPADKYAYVFTEMKDGKLSIKIYQPMNTKGFKWCMSMDASVISLWTKVPEKGDKIIIASSTKDALCISSQLHIPAIAPQGEGYDISETACKELKRRYKKIFICYDTDAPGIADAKKLSKRTGFPYIVPDLGKSKDFSDYYKSLENKEDFQKLKELFN
jgi:hypothetical protein